MKLSELLAIAPHLPSDTEVTLPHIGRTEAAVEAEAYWKVWGGWSGNHDQRIEDATCSKCGYKHPTVHRSLKNLSPTCMNCKSSMSIKED